jgi:tripeptidyl-peptidase-1
MRFVGQLTFLAAGCLAVPLVENHVLHEHQGLISRGWKRSLKLDDDVQVPVRIGLKQNNIHKSYQLLMDV